MSGSQSITLTGSRRKTLTLFNTESTLARFSFESLSRGIERRASRRAAALVLASDKLE